MFVDDGSTDRTLKKIKAISKKDKKVRVLTFYRNFGKANALCAGFKKATGDIVFTMDGDLQDDPAEFRNFIKEMEKGYDLVTGWKFHRKDPLGKRIPSKFFNFLIRKMTGVEVHDSNCGFKAYRTEVIDTIDVYGEFHRYLPIIAHWRGFRVSEIKVKHHKRTSGKSKYGLERLFKGLVDLITVTFLVKYGRSPMYFFGSLSVMTFILSILGTVWTVVDALTKATSIEWVFGLGSLSLLFFSILFLSMGYLSEMLLAAVGHERMTRSFYREL
jgi:glycosyltransferase involved in cell wall biosynthesis